MKYPNFNEEKKLWKKGYNMVVGIDEVGRGPLAGPVVAAAFCFKANKEIYRGPSSVIYRGRASVDFGLVRDSKQLTAVQREVAYNVLKKDPNIIWGVGRVSEKIIDKINIKNAAELAMERALANLEKKINRRTGFLLIDGSHLNNYKLKTTNYKLIIKGDQKVFSIAAASIIAKVTRDRIMLKYHKKYPDYCFDKNKGYPTKLHKNLIEKYGICKIHRKSFKIN